MKADAERGTWGAWARRERTKRDWTVEEVAARLATEAGVRVDVATIRGVEGGSKSPSVRLQDALALVFGSRPEGQRQPTDSSAAILAALTEQTQLLAQLWPAMVEVGAAVNRLVEALGKSHIEAELRADAEADVLAEQTDLLVQNAEALRALLGDASSADGTEHRRQSRQSTR